MSPLELIKKEILNHTNWKVVWPISVWTLVKSPVPQWSDTHLHTETIVGLAVVFREALYLTKTQRPRGLPLSLIKTMLSPFQTRSIFFKFSVINISCVLTES